MADIAERHEPVVSPTADDADEPVFQRHRRARRVAEQSWGEFFRELSATTLLLLAGGALLVVVLTAIFRG